MAGKCALTEPETQVMSVAWENGSVSAKEVIAKLQETCGYSSSTSYTLIYRCIKKGALKRSDPGFVLTPVVSRQDIQDEQTRQLVDRLFDGSIDNLFSALIDRKQITPETVHRMMGMLEEYEKTDG